MLSLGVAAFAIACQPLVEDHQVPTLLGEKCGGMCDSFGQCAIGLECAVPAPTVSPFSLAILSSQSHVAGVCKAPTAAADTPVEASESAPVEAAAAEPEDRRKLQFGGAGHVVGGQHQADIESPEVAAAAKHGLVMILRESNSLTPPTLKRIVSATSQVVAGIKYTLELELSDATRHRVTVVDQAWMNPRYNILEHTILSR